jgi:hypothetical protein
VLGDFSFKVNSMSVKYHTFKSKLIVLLLGVVLSSCKNNSGNSSTGEQSNSGSGATSGQGTGTGNQASTVTNMETQDFNLAKARINQLDAVIGNFQSYRSGMLGIIDDLITEMSSNISLIIPSEFDAIDVDQGEAIKARLNEISAKLLTSKTNIMDRLQKINSINLNIPDAPVLVSPTVTTKSLQIQRSGTIEAQSIDTLSDAEISQQLDSVIAALIKRIDSVKEKVDEMQINYLSYQVDTISSAFQFDKQVDADTYEKAASNLVNVAGSIDLATIKTNPMFKEKVNFAILNIEKILKEDAITEEQSKNVANAKRILESFTENGERNKLISMLNDSVRNLSLLKSQITQGKNIDEFDLTAVKNIQAYAMVNYGPTGKPEEFSMSLFS